MNQFSLYAREREREKEEKEEMKDTGLIVTQVFAQAVCLHTHNPSSSSYNIQILNRLAYHSALCYLVENLYRGLVRPALNML